MQFTNPITEVIKARFSCRAYTTPPFEEEEKNIIEHLLSKRIEAPFQNKIRFHLITSQSDSSKELKSFGTYGAIRDARAFIVGAVKDSKNPMALEDFGYLMEQFILYATDINLGTCWLAASFNAGTFAQKINLQENEDIPAVTAIGYPLNKMSFADIHMKILGGAKKRKPWEELFFEDNFERSLSPERTADYAIPLEMVRLGPSGVNYQPWRIVKKQKENLFHFFLKRNYQKSNPRLFFRKLADWQRLDMGIAMCHFELTSQNQGLQGNWVIMSPSVGILPNNTEYLVSWKEERQPQIKNKSAN